MERLAIDVDDRPVGRILTRREILALLGGSALVAACAPNALGSPSATAAATQAAATTAAATAAGSAAAVLPSCVVRPALTEGPYFVDEKLNRSDIRSDPATSAVKPGVTLALTFLVSKVSGTSCAALANATVDVWHCDALGVYSDATDPSFGSTKGTKFLRGYQTTDATGTAKFTTIWPGWYQGRAVHIHFKIRADAQASVTHEFTSQLFFDDTLSRQVYAQAPYAAKGLPTMTNADDGIFQGGGDQLLLDVKANDSGYAATFDIGLQTA